MIAGSKEYFIQVRHELNGIKKHAEHYEIERISIEALQSGTTDRCIYGLMTGYCYSLRAAEILKNINLEYIKVKGGEIIPNAYIKLDDYIYRDFHSLLEHCIVAYPYNNESIVKFLKGETKFVNLKLRV